MSLLHMSQYTCANYICDPNPRRGYKGQGYATNVSDRQWVRRASLEANHTSWIQFHNCYGQIWWFILNVFINLHDIEVYKMLNLKINTVRQNKCT